MSKVRLYDTPEEFAAMMMRQLSDCMNVSVQQKEDDVLMLDVQLSADNKIETLQVNLHNAFRTYMAGGNLNAAIDYLNDIMRVSRRVKASSNIAELDGAYIFPAIRDERYAEESMQSSPFVSDSYLPGLRVIFIEIKNDLVKIVSESMLKHNPRLTEEKVKRLAYRNLISAGWLAARASMRSPFRPSCIVDVYADNPHPVECQFLLAKMAAYHMPANYVIAYTNRKHTLVMRSDEPMETMDQAQTLVEKAKFQEIVKGTFHLMPYSVSDRIYWVHNGEAKLLEMP